jgi:hypothetical protein
VVIWLGVQALTGILARIIQYSGSLNTNVCFWFKRFHYISGYGIMAAAKFDYLNINFRKGFDGGFIVLLLIDLACLALYLWLKFDYWTLSEETVDNQLVFNEAIAPEGKIKQLFHRIKQCFNNVRA